MTENINDFKVVRTSETITVFWKKPIMEICLYELILNDNIIATTDKTHYTFEGLEPDTEYEIEIKCHVENDHDDQGQDVHANITCSTKSENRIIDITSSAYNAVCDGVTMNTAAIQRAIDDCQNGETVYIPNGIFKTEELTFHNDMSLYLEEGAVLQGTQLQCHSCENVVIYGKGTFASSGRGLVNISNSQNIVLFGITFRDVAACNLEASTNCAIFGCVFYFGADSITIKSGKNTEENDAVKPTEHIWIFDCKCELGKGIAIGSEMSGGIKDVDIWDCEAPRFRFNVVEV